MEGSQIRFSPNGLQLMPFAYAISNVPARWLNRFPVGQWATGVDLVADNERSNFILGNQAFNVSPFNGVGVGFWRVSSCLLV